MPYKNKPRPYKKEYQQQLARGEKDERKVREQARDLIDRKGVDRDGKDIEHIVPLSKGGSNSKSNLRLVKPETNRSFKRNSDRSVNKNTNS